MGWFGGTPFFWYKMIQNISKKCTFNHHLHVACPFSIQHGSCFQKTKIQPVQLGLSLGICNWAFDVPLPKLNATSEQSQFISFYLLFFFALYCPSHFLRVSFFIPVAGLPFSPIRVKTLLFESNPSTQIHRSSTHQQLQHNSRLFRVVHDLIHHEPRWTMKLELHTFHHLWQNIVFSAIRYSLPFNPFHTFHPSQESQVIPVWRYPYIKINAGY